MKFSYSFLKIAKIYNAEKNEFYHFSYLGMQVHHTVSKYSLYR